MLTFNICIKNVESAAH